jgi:dihydropteroate synthase
MTINCLGKLIDLDHPKVMGILNLTPDSFYDGGRYLSSDLIVKRAAKMLEEGATFIDLGAYSSRPGATDISEEEELARLLPAVEILLQAFPGILLSVDTFRSTVAKKCLDLGAAMINDISAGGLDNKMMASIAGYQVPYIIMHMKGKPQDMQEMAQYEDITGEVLYYFSEKLVQARALGINDCILDPGFGFAKTRDQNYALLQQLDQISGFGFPLMVGLSRKSMIYKILNSSAEEALNGTTALHMVALLKGARILRVHDVKEAVECIALYKAVEN